MALPVPVSEAARLSETPVAFARVCLCGVETAIAFAGEKWVFLVHFPGAEVTPVSPVLCWGRAVVLLVSTSPRCRASVKSWGCAQVVDGLSMRLLSGPLVRWGICRRGWCGCGIGGVAAAQVKVAAVPVGGGRARAGLEIEHSERSSRVAISRAGRRPPAHRAAIDNKMRARAARRSGGGTSWEVSAPRPRR